MNLAQKNILITGALGGLGKAFTKEFAGKSANLILTDLDENGTGDHTYFSADFTDQNQIINLVEKITSDYNKIDILINNAGIGVYEGLKNITPEGWFNSYDINVHAPFILTKLLLPNLMAAENPLVVNIGSKCGIHPKDGRVAYNSTKFALRGLSLTLSDEFKDSKLQVSLLTLGSVLTDFGPTSIEERKKMQKKGKNYLTPEEVAKQIVERVENDTLTDEIEL